jgi:phage-related protein
VKPKQPEKQRAKVSWEGDSLNVIRSFPKDIRADLGAELDRLQRGEKPLNSRPMRSIGKKVFELKEQDKRAWYRVIYVSKVKDTIYVLHCFEKDSRKTSKEDLAIAKSRFKMISSGHVKEKK